VKTIGLTMIVKDEAHIIARCLASVLPLVDYFLLVDTGSRDGTQAAIADFLRAQNLPGAIVDEPWRDFAYNRSFALERLRQHSAIDYALMIDADEVLVFEPGFEAAAFKARLDADLYDIRTVMGETSYWRPQLCSNRLPFHYKGVLHEYLDGSQLRSRAAVSGFVNRPIQDSARNRDPQKYRRDAAALEEALRHETDPFLVARYTFYLAQSYRDGGRQQAALEAYLRRAQQGFWDQEVYISLLQAARLMEQLGHAPGEVIAAYLRAHEALPARLEALLGAARLCRLERRYQQGYVLARHGLTIEPPRDGLFLERAVAEHALLDEFAVLAYWAGQYEESLDACQRLLLNPRLPASERPRIEANLDFALARLDGRRTTSNVPDRATNVPPRATNVPEADTQGALASPNRPPR
jgi:hypothetical protein